MKRHIYGFIFLFFILNTTLVIYSCSGNTNPDFFTNSEEESVEDPLESEMDETSEVDFSLSATSPTIADGDFEAATLISWTKLDTCSVVKISNPQGGKQLSLSGSGLCRIRQTLQGLQAGHTYRIKGDYELKKGALEFRLRCNTCTSQTVKASRSTVSGQRKSFELTFEWTGPSTVNYIVYTNKANAYVDNLLIEDLTPPPPAEEEEPPPPSDNFDENYGTTYYIRPAGGDASQCNGKSNSDYPGSGTGVACAWKHPFIAFPPGGTSLIAAGDRLIIGNGSYRMGLGAAGATNTSVCHSAWPWDCVMAQIPSGLDTHRPTRIYGETWEAACTSAPKLYGVERSARIINLSNRNNIRINCLEITDNSECIEFHANAANKCERNVYPYGEWASVGIYANTASNITLKNINIHGLAHSGIHAGKISDWSLENVKIKFNGWVGWDGDLGNGDSINDGTISFNNVNVEWNGCSESLTSSQPLACWGQSAGGYGDGMGTATTGGNWVFTNSTFSHNTSDGLDLLYHNGNGSIILDRVKAEGNAGNQIKTKGTTSIRNSVIVGNCAYFSGQSFTYNVDHCRALGNALSLNFFDNTQTQLINNTVFTQGDCHIVASTSSSCNGATLYSRNNIFVGGTDFHQNFEKSCFYYSECSGIQFDNDYSMIYNTKTSPCSGNDNNLCSNPLLDSRFTQTSSHLTENDYSMIPSVGSPAINSGINLGSLLPGVDFTGASRLHGTGVDRGAYEQ